MAELTGDAEVFGVGELRPGKDFMENLKWTTLMGQDDGTPSITPKNGDFHRESPDIHTDE